MVSPFQLGLEFPRRIDRGVNLAAEGLLGSLQGAHHSLELRVTDEYQVYIARPRLFSFGHRTVDKCQLDLVRQGRQGIAENIANPGGLNRKGFELCEERALGISLVVHLAAP